MDSSVIIALFALIGSVITAVTGGVVAVMIARLNTNQKARADQQQVAVEQVKDTLRTNTEIAAQDMAALKHVTDQTHAAVNGSHSAVLLHSWKQADRIAWLTKDPADAELAKMAEATYRTHEAAIANRPNGE